MLIDAAHEEETRVVVLDGQNLEEFDIETKAKQQIRGNIYLAKVTRVEPSLQACFVDFGSPRHGFLAFSEVHPDYYQIPVADREALIEEEANSVDEEAFEDDEENQRARRAVARRYKIQDVLKRRQIMLVQAVKEERGNKGAALTTYLSLAGRYCVLMPNTPRGGGISRKITAAGDRKRLKSIVSQLEVPKGMGLIIRTAGAKRNKTEIKRDYEYLLRLWDNIRTHTLESVAPALIHEEESLVKRAIRDLYNKDVGSIVIEGENAYKEAKDFVKMLIPSHARKVHQYKHTMPLFSKLGVEKMLSSIHSGVVHLKSGGYIVINQTEALVAVDVNSGKSTRERSIEQTALKTNLEAADEVARQMRMRDLAGLIVIDFIDMDEARNDRAVEKRVKEALRLDRARVQMGKISNFGLMEISRQRRRTGVLEGSSHVCEVCEGFGRVRSSSSNATQIVRDIEAQVGGRKNCELVVKTDVNTALYLLNEKRTHIAMLEISRNVVVKILADSSMPQGKYEIDFVAMGDATDEPDFNFNFIKEAAEAVAKEDAAEEAEDEANEIEAVETTETIVPKNSRRRKSRRRGRNKGEANDANVTAIANNSETETSSETIVENSGEVVEVTAEGEEPKNSRRRRGKRGGRGLFGMRAARNKSMGSDNSETSEVANNSDAITETVVEVTAEETNQKETTSEEKLVKSRPTRSRKPKAKIAETEAVSNDEPVNVSEIKEEKPVKKPRARKAKPADAVVTETKTDEIKSEPTTMMSKSSDSQPTETVGGEDSGPRPQRKTGWWARNASKLFGNTEEQ